MQYRPLGRTGYNVSAISFGTWAIGGSWGKVSDDDSTRALLHAIDRGVNFIDTADVYGDGRSERLIADVMRQRPGKLTVATKAGRRLRPHTAEGYTPANIEAFVDRSLTNLRVDTLDIVQLHCPPTAVYYNPDLFAGLEAITAKGKVKHWGASVATVEEGLKAIEYDVIKTIQIIFNCFRLRPAGLFLQQAKSRNVGVLARVPLASGLLTGKLKPEQTYADDDHRKFNRLGEAFDAGETFSGMGHDLPTAFAAVEEIRRVVPAGMTMTQFALRWILMHEAVTCAIPGAKRIEQVDDNCAAADLPALSESQMAAVRGTYERRIGPQVHHRW